jgi:hypothetical protein
MSRSLDAGRFWLLVFYSSFLSSPPSSILTPPCLSRLNLAQPMRECRAVRKYHAGTGCGWFPIFFFLADKWHQTQKTYDELLKKIKIKLSFV